MKCRLCQKKLSQKYNNYFYCESCGVYQIDFIQEYNTENSTWGTEDKIVESYLSGKRWREKIFRDRLNLIELLYPNVTTLLDIGSATGLFASIVKEKNIEVDVVEPYKPFKEYSINHNKNINHFDTINEVNKTYDFITIFDTFGYTKDLLGTLEKINKLLNSGGYLMITAGWIDDDMQSVHDFSFNYYFKSKFWKEIFPEIAKLNLIKFWTENKNFNTKKYGMQEWWSDYLMLSDEIKMNYIIYKKN